MQHVLQVGRVAAAGCAALLQCKTLLSCVFSSGFPSLHTAARQAVTHPRAPATLTRIGAWQAPAHVPGQRSISRLLHGGGADAGEECMPHGRRHPHVVIVVAQRRAMLQLRAKFGRKIPHRAGLAGSSGEHIHILEIVGGGQAGRQRRQQLRPDCNISLGA